MVEVTTDVFGLAMLGLGAVVLLTSLRYAWAAGRVVRAPPFGSIEDPTAGARVTAEGTARPGADGPLASPLRDRDALAVEATVEERRLGFPALLLPTWVQLARTSVTESFRVRTPTVDLALVEPTSSVVLESEMVTVSAPDDDWSESVAAFERRHGVPERTIWQRRPPVLGAFARGLSLGARRYREGSLEPGEDVFVAGRLVETNKGFGVAPRVVSDRSSAATFWDAARTALVGSAAGAGGLLVGAVLLLA